MHTDAYLIATRIAATVTMQASLQVRTHGANFAICEPEDADDTFEKVTAAFAKGKGYNLMVSRVGLAGSCYPDTPFGLGKVAGSATVNAMARHWHDFMHHQHQLPFNLFGELQAARMQMKWAANHLHAKGYTCAEILPVLRIIWCDVAEQAIHFEDTAEHVADQAEFVARRFAESGRAEQEALAVMGVVLFQRIQSGAVDA